MKRNLLALSAVVLAIVASSFTTSRFADVYFIYNSGTQTVLGSYSPSSDLPDPVSGTTVLAWFRGAAANPSQPTSTEFTNSFNAVDNHFGGSTTGTLNDETTEDHSILEKKAS